MQQESQKVLAVLTLADMKVIRITRLTDRESVGDFYWVGPNRLMYTSTKNFGSLAAPFGTGAWYAMDADGGHPRTLVSYSSDANTGRNRMVHYGEVYQMLEPDSGEEPGHHADLRRLGRRAEPGRFDRCAPPVAAMNSRAHRATTAR